MARDRSGSTSVPPYSAGQPAPRMPSRARRACSSMVWWVPLQYCSPTHAASTLASTQARAASRWAARSSLTVKSISGQGRGVEPPGQFGVAVPRITGDEGPCFGPAEIELDVVFEGAAVATVELQALGRRLKRRLGREQERHTGQGAGRGLAGVGGPRRLEGKQAGPLQGGDVVG